MGAEQLRGHICVCLGAGIRTKSFLYYLCFDQYVWWKIDWGKDADLAFSPPYQRKTQSLKCNPNIFKMWLYLLAVRIHLFCSLSLQLLICRLKKNKWGLFLNQILVNKDLLQGLNLHNRESPFLCMLAGLKGEGRSYTTIGCCLLVVRERGVCKDESLNYSERIEPFKEYKILCILLAHFK